MTIRIANGAGFLGDDVGAPRQLVESSQVDYLTLEYLAELTLSILARIREKDPVAGYAADFLDVLRSLTDSLSRQPQLHIVTNAGGMNPRSCVRAAAEILVAAGMPDTPIGAVYGDDLLGRLESLQQQGCELAHLDTGQPLRELDWDVVSANAYLGAAPIVEALGDRARLVITGRVADASLTLGPARHELGWAADAWDQLAAGSVAGHLIECGAQVTGGYSIDWDDRNLANVGYPIAEISADGQTVITKPPGSGGVVNRKTVAEQLVYEIGDPRRYITPDVIVDFTSVDLESSGRDRVTVRGARGEPAPDCYKVSLAYRDGFTASSQLLVYGRDCVRKARACAAMVLERLDRAGFLPDERYVELLGTGAGVPSSLHNAENELSSHQAAADARQESLAQSDPPEVVLRISVRDQCREAVEYFTKQIAPLITSGPAGLAGYASGRSPVRPVFAYWPALVPKPLVTPQVEVRSARQWIDGS